MSPTCISSIRHTNTEINKIPIMCVSHFFIFESSNWVNAVMTGMTQRIVASNSIQTSLQSLCLKFPFNTPRPRPHVGNSSQWVITIMTARIQRTMSSPSSVATFWLTTVGSRQGRQTTSNLRISHCSEWLPIGLHSAAINLCTKAVKPNECETESNSIERRGRTHTWLTRVRRYRWRHHVCSAVPTSHMFRLPDSHLLLRQPSRCCDKLLSTEERSVLGEVFWYYWKFISTAV